MDEHGNWNQVGKLNRTRRGHNVILVGGSLLVIGDWFETVNEKCTLKNDNITCVDQTLILKDYYVWPELFLVPDSFCKT